MVPSTIVFPFQDHAVWHAVGAINGISASLFFFFFYGDSHLSALISMLVVTLRSW